ncbi:MAG TPA: galactose mutarotase [Candidatus Pullilachnospira intestinigallinarum]|nr:galactose mutarotase [Candidatus Pullilachnospira intestinigallinarum]
MSVVRQDFGKTKDGRAISLYTVTNKKGAVMKVTDFGAILVSVMVPDRDGRLTDVVLGFDSGEDYEQKNVPHFGATIGRNGNRIDQSAFILNGERVQLTPNENENNLHSGPVGYDLMMWEGQEKEDGVAFHRISPDGEQGFPGNFDVTVTYTLTEENAVQIHYEGICDKDTVANMTNHSYFNLGGHASGSVCGQLMQLNASRYTPVKDSRSIPTGQIVPVAGTPMDFREPRVIGEEIDADFEQLRLTGGYDHNFVLDRSSDGLEWMARAFCRENGIYMEAFTDRPGVQFYTGNFIDGEKGKEGAVYAKRQGFCLESQYFPNSVNDPHFAHPFLAAGEKYDTRTVYRFSVR